jgi:hypothetical protein
MKVWRQLIRLGDNYLDSETIMRFGDNYEIRRQL